MGAAERKVDAKGRVLIPELADARVHIEAINEHEFIVRRVVSIPAREQWLWNNPGALASVQRGLTQAKAGEFVPDPRKGKDYSWLEEVDEDGEE